MWNNIFSVFSDGPLFSPDHQLSLLAEGVEKPRRKRGRPPKQSSESMQQKEENGEEEKDIKKETEEEIFEGDGRRKRKIRPPLKYEGVIQVVFLELPKSNLKS